MISLGSYIENPYYDFRTIKEAATFFGDSLRVNSTTALTAKSLSTNEDLEKLRLKVMKKNSATEEMIAKFEKNLVNLILAEFTYDRHVLKFYGLPEIILNAAKDIPGFTLKREHLPDRLIMYITHTSITLLPYGFDAPCQFDLFYDIYEQDWTTNEPFTE